MLFTGKKKPKPHTLELFQEHASVPQTPLSGLSDQAVWFTDIKVINSFPKQLPINSYTGTQGYFCLFVCTGTQGCKSKVFPWEAAARAGGHPLASVREQGRGEGHTMGDFPGTWPGKTLGLPVRRQAEEQPQDPASWAPRTWCTEPLIEGLRASVSFTSQTKLNTLLCI